MASSWPSIGGGRTACGKIRRTTVRPSLSLLLEIGPQRNDLSIDTWEPALEVDP